MWKRILAIGAVAAFLTLPGATRASDAEDTVFLVNGGRVRGTVMEEDPAKGVTVKLPDGSVRKIAPAEVKRVQYGAEAPKPAPLPAPARAAPAPGYAPPVPAAAPPRSEVFVHDGMALGFSAGLMLAINDHDYALRNDLHLVFDFGISRGFYVRAEAGTYAAAMERAHYYSQPSGTGVINYTYVAAGQIGIGLKLHVEAGYDIKDWMTVRLGGLIGGVVTSVGSVSDCPSGGGVGPIAGGSGAYVFRAGADRRIEAGLHLEGGYYPYVSCYTSYNTSTMPPTTTPYTHMSGTGFFTVGLRAAYVFY
jgi:hypothetical protein